MISGASLIDFHWLLNFSELSNGIWCYDHTTRSCTTANLDWISTWAIGRYNPKFRLLGPTAPTLDGPLRNLREFEKKACWRWLLQDEARQPKIRVKRLPAAPVTRPVGAGFRCWLYDFKCSLVGKLKKARARGGKRDGER